MDRLMSAYTSTVALFRSSLQSHVPPGPYRAFHIWAMSQANPNYKTWQQIVGIPQFAKLTVTLLDGLVNYDKWPQLMEHAARMNAYLIYETISDNLAIGLAYKREDDETFALRKKVLSVFNDAMAIRLKGDTARSKELLESIRSDAARISAFKQSLTDEDQRKVASHYLECSDASSDDADDIEYGTWGALVANVETCVLIVDNFKEKRLGSYLRESLIWRYEAVGRLLKDDDFSIEELKEISTHSILVIPVLAYYISVLVEVLYPNPKLDEVIKNGVLAKALEDAALMVRLTNDLGTVLVTHKKHFAPLFNQLYQKIEQLQDNASMTDFLCDTAPSDVRLTRIHKDVIYGEYNVSLHNLMDAPVSPRALLLFGTNVAHFSDCYHQRRTRLQTNLAELTCVLGDNTISNLIERFVTFHERIYSYEFDKQSGDYATKPNQQLA